MSQSGVVAERADDTVNSKLDWLRSQLGIMQSEMENAAKERTALEVEIERLKGELMAMKEGPQGTGAAASFSGIMAMPCSVGSPRGCEELKCVHLGKGDFEVKPGTTGLEGHGKPVESWLDHLGSTLFVDGQDDFWIDLNDHLYYFGGFYEVSGCYTPASRCFLLKCRKCNAAVRGSYGMYDTEQRREESRRVLGSFCLNRGSNGAGTV